MKRISKQKEQGQVFTPAFIVDIMLDFIGYFGQKEKHIIDNSAGEGAFLVAVVERYIKNFNGNLKNLKKGLENFIHGIELDRACYKKCLENLDKKAAEFNIFDVKWDILNADSLKIDKFNGLMDFVVGNPPYVRIHNLNDTETVKNFSFAKKGMTDLYIVFFEIGFKMLNATGKMCYIAPSSYFTSKAGIALREYIIQNKNLSAMIDLGHFQPFNGATTYTCISAFDRNRNNEIDYYTLENEAATEFQDKLTYDDILIQNDFYFAKKEKLKKLEKILTFGQGNKKALVKNGYATLCDKVFISNLNLKSNIDVIKASTGEWSSCIYPYDKKNKSIPFEKLDEATRIYLELNKDRLLNRDIKTAEEWYLFGRTQAISDTFKDKIAINILIKDMESVKINYVKAGQGVYSGLYILSKVDFKQIKDILKTPDFIEYVKMLKKYKSGGYYTFSSGDLEIYLNYKLRD